MNPPRALRTLIPASAAVIALAIAGPALAVDRCVNTNGCTAPNSYTASQLQTALTAAGAAGSGRVLVGAGTYVAPPAGFVLSTPAAVEVVGAGIGTTIVQSGPAQPVNNYAIALDKGSSVIRNLTIRTSHAGVRGLLLGGTTSARQVAIEGTVAAAGSWGAFLEGSGTGPLLEDSTVTMAGSAATALAMFSPGTVRTSTLIGERGIASSNGQANPAVVSQTKIVATLAGIVSDGGTMAVRDTAFRITGTAGAAVTASNLNNGITPIVITLDRVTMSGTDGPSQTGVTSQANGAGPDSATVTVRNSIITRFGVPLRRVASGGSAQLATAFTDHSPTGVVSQNTGTGTGSLTETSPLDVPVAFVNANAGNWQLVAGSALIDAGDPADTGTIDLTGGARPRDGNGDGTARVDPGAVESPAIAVVIPGTGGPLVPATPADTTRPKVTRLRFTLEGPIARLRARVSEAGTLRVRIARPGVRRARVLVVGVPKAGPVRAGFRLARGVRYRITVTARDRAGNLSPATTRSLRPAVRRAR